MKIPITMLAILLIFLIVIAVLTFLDKVDAATPQSSTQSIDAVFTIDTNNEYVRFIDKQYGIVCYRVQYSTEISCVKAY